MLNILAQTHTPCHAIQKKNKTKCNFTHILGARIRKCSVTPTHRSKCQKRWWDTANERDGTRQWVESTHSVTFAVYVRAIQIRFSVTFQSNSNANSNLDVLNWWWKKIHCHFDKCQSNCKRNNVVGKKFPFTM